VAAPTHLQSADKALTSLFEKYSSDPSMEMGVRLSKALIARGHAAEALQITDYSLSLEPASTEGRIHRAAALIELSRPKAAFVELQRILAIEPSHGKATRMLGQVYVDLGHPERAAKLLRKRISDLGGNSQSQEVQKPTLQEPSTRVQVPSVVSKADTAQTVDDSVPVIGDLFASLTNDLGLGGFPTDFASESSNVEVTQVVRARISPKQMGPQTELTSLAGPIVDRSRTGSDSRSPLPRHESNRPSTAYEIVTSPELHHTWDEDNLAKDSPFKISPITQDGGFQDQGDTIEEPLPNMNSVSKTNAVQRQQTTPDEEHIDTPPDFLSMNTDPEAKVAAPYLKRFEKGSPATNERPESSSFKETQVHANAHTASRGRFSLTLSIIIALLAFGLGMLVASSNQNTQNTKTPTEDSTPTER